MATKTLGIKFEIAGVKEAQAGLDNLRKNLNSTLEQNKKEVKSYQKGIARSWRRWKIENFGTISQKQNLIIQQERAEFRKRSTYKGLSKNNRAVVLEFRLAYREFFRALDERLEDLTPEKTGIIERAFSAVSAPLQFGLDAILFPFQSALAGAFERMGEVQVQDFAEGFNQNLQKALGFSFEETGGDVGKVIGTSLYKVYQRSVNAVDDYVKGKLRFDLADTLIEAFTYTTKTLAKELPALALRTHRRIQVNKKAIPEAKVAAGLAMVNNKLPEATKKDIEDNKSITLVYGGANTDRADIGKDYTARVMKPYLKGSAVIPLERQWTNSAVDSEFQGDIKNLIKLILGNQATAATFKSFVSENGLQSLPAREREELVASLDLEGELDLSDIDKIAEVLESLMGNKDFSMGKALQATFKGYNPDDVLGAAEAIALMEQFPDKELQIGGFSQGGYNALGTVDLLNRMGYTNVKGFSIGTPITGANATINPDNFRSFMGTKDYYYNALTGLAGDEIDFPEFFEVGEGEGAMHSLQGYVRGDSVKGGLQEFLKGRVSIPSKEEYGKHDSAYGYAVGELGAETGLIRTLLTYLGESKFGNIDTSEGFIFSAEESLPGYTKNIKKLGKGLKDEDTKKFHAEYIDFLETFQKELEIAEQFAAIGKQYKPVESLKKAAKIFPKLEGLANKETVGFDPSKESIFEYEAKQRQIESDSAEVAQKPQLVAFNRKVKQQKDNIERTFQAMLGRKFSKKDESKGIYSFYNEEDYSQRADNFAGMVEWLKNDVLDGASDEDKNSVRPILDLLDSITESIRSTGKTGELDLQTIRDAQSLLGIDLREFNLLFKEFEAANAESVDVKKFKDELRVARRNRDQILNEKKTPAVVAQSLESAIEKLHEEGEAVAEEIEKTPEPSSSLKDIPTEELNQDLADAYTQKLNKIVEDIGAKAVEDLKNGTANIDTDGEYKNIKAKIKQYRKAVKDGAFERARELGESLLAEAEYLKQVLGAGETSKKGQLKRMQGEVISGDAGMGRSPIGLPQLQNQVRSVQLELDLTEVGEQATAGVEQELNSEAGEDIGSDFAGGIVSGAEDELDINSPSRVFAWIGQMVREGFSSSVEDIGQPLARAIDEAVSAATESLSTLPDIVSEVAQSLNDSEGLLDNLFATEGVDEAVNGFFSDLVENVSGFFDGIVERFPILGRLRDFLAEIGGELFQSLVLLAFGGNLIEFSDAALAAAAELESLEKAITSVSRGSIAAAKNIAFIRKEAKNLSIDIVTATEAYTRILGATRNTPLEGLQTEQIFSTLAATAKNRGLSADATSRLFLGFEQVIAKGEFKSEEVRGQLAEVIGDIQNLLATSVGVPVSQLGEMMEAGDLKAVDVMPKVLAQLNAQNAAVGDSSKTAVAAQTRLNNAIMVYQDAVGRKLQPVQKMGLNTFSAVVEKLTEQAGLIVKLVTGGLTTILVNLTLRIVSIRAALLAAGDGLNFISSVLRRMLPQIAKFMARFVLITAAIEVLRNNIKLVKNAFPELSDRIESSTKRLNALAAAFAKASTAASKYNKNQPGQLQLKEGLDISSAPKWLQNIAGGDRINLDNLIRNRWNGVIDRMDASNRAASGGSATPIKGRITTQAQKKQADFIVGSGEIIANVDRTLTYGNEAKKVLSEIQSVDAIVRDLQSQRLNLLPGDVEGLKAALAKETKIFATRDKLLAKSSQYSESLQAEIQAVTDTLADAADLDDTGGTSEEIKQRLNNKKALTQRLDLLKKEKSAIDEINSKIPKFLSQIDRIIRNSSERVEGFIANQDDDAIALRTEAITEAVEKGITETDLQITLDEQKKEDLTSRINFVNSEIAKLEEKLESSYIQEGVAGLERAASEQGLELTAVTLERMLDEGRSSQEIKAANLLLQLDDYGAVAAGFESELADLIKNNRDRLKENKRAISDYFFKINQQIKEATIETSRLYSEIFYTNIKNKLRSAIAPGSNTFIGNIIGNIQSVIDQAQQVAEKVFGDRAADLGFESESRTMATEMQDFIRQIGNAGDAVENFVNRLNVNGSSNNNLDSSDLSAEGSSVAKNALSWQGKHFKEGVYAMCAGFVRQVLKDSGVDVGVTKNPIDAGKQPHNGELMARSFFGDDIGTVFKDKNQAQAGDIIGFFDTYQYGQEPGAITHVGIYQGNDMMIDRSTSSAPVRNRSIDTFGKGNYIFVRPHQYQDTGSSISEFEAKNNTGSNSKAIKQNQKLIALKQKNLDITKRTTEQERKSLAIQIKQTIEQNKRQAAEGRKENARNLIGLESKFANFGLSYDYQSAAGQSKSALRQIKQQFLDADLDTATQLRNTEDAIATINKTIPILDAEIAKLKDIGTPEALGLVKVKESARSELIKSFFALNDTLEKVLIIQSETAALEEKYTTFITSQNKLKEHTERLNKRNLVLTQKAAIAEQRGTVEAGRKVKKHQEDLRLYLRINEFKQQYAPGEYLDSLIAGEQRQSQINQDNINYDAQIAELDLEKRLLDYQSGIGDKKAGFASRIGDVFGSDKIKRENAIAQENLRFERELIELRRAYKDQPELLEEFARAATELNSVNLESIKNEFKTLGKTVEGLFISSAQGFFSSIQNDLFDTTGAREKAELEERLRYAEQLVSLENQYREQPGQLAHMKNRAKELNEQKLDKINNEFNVFKKGVDLAKQALLEFVKQLAAAIAQAAAAKVIGAIVGGIAGGFGGGVAAVGNDYGSGAGASAFVANKGATVGDDIKSRKISDRTTNYLRQNNPGVNKAWRLEGRGAKLGVFHDGEELLSHKTGEAPIYQTLKSKLGLNPLQQLVPYFADGGTFDARANILSKFKSTTPKASISALNNPSRSMPSVKNITLQTTVITPDADSFRLNEDQRNQDLIIRLQRGI